jgi:protocatechuate 3,4-dioxygenase beta subunit
MERKLDRRQALTVIGTVSLSGILAACGDDSGKSEVATTDGTTTSVQAKTRTTTSGVTADLFDASSSCSLTPEETEGPYYFDVDSIRSDIREDRKGTLLRLGIRVRDAQSCKPLENAVVDAPSFLHRP